MTAHTPQAADYSAAMKRALELAGNGPSWGLNPQVGCVLLDATGTIVAEGWHQGSGTPHAEIVALDNLAALGRKATDLTAVVTLEPCAHTGKTGPCVEALITAGVGRVVYSVADAGAHSGGGAALLEKAGIEVIGGVESIAGEALIERWLYSARHQKPWVTLKWAMSLDGRSAAADGSSQWITGEQTREKVHRDRSTHDAIVVGTSTAVVDNPRLTARTPDGGLYDHQPLAVVVGERDLPDDLVIREHPGGFLHSATHDLPGVLDDLYARDVRSVYVEGGATLASAFVKDHLVDEFHITMGPVLLGGSITALGELGVGTMKDAHQLRIRSVETFGDDVVITARSDQEGSR
jgi:diaminohydroxyphosphoribosylaminopyrimidine deaminase / 5-amino-6-(5-phosphoribosylamino)uracil reductase